MNRTPLVKSGRRRRVWSGSLWPLPSTQIW